MFRLGVLQAGVALLGLTAAFALPTFAQQSHVSRPVPSRLGMPSAEPWWKHAVLYEIYPRSFKDSDGDGTGDLNGITEKLGYLQSLGIDAIWIAPMYPSPQVDFGYDISDYEAVDPQYGTMADFDKLVAEGQKHHIRVILDMVMNHTSDKHAWFIESASSRTNPKADWYVWNDGIPASTPGISETQKKFAHDGMAPPNNWLSTFGGSAWEWVPARKQFYYHYFYIQQPDLNWRSPEVQKAMYDTIRFWLDKGVAGFRFDAVPTLFEDPALLNEEANGEGTNAQGDPMLKTVYQENLPDVHDIMRAIRKIADGYPGDRVLIGETYLPNVAELDKWYGGEKHDELQLPMDFRVGFTNKLDATTLRDRINEAQIGIHGSQPLFVFDNHDNKRSWDRYTEGITDPEAKQRIARLLATLLLTSKDTALMYDGEEIGLVTSTPTRKEDVKDPIGITGWPREKGRDGERTPMQWDAGKDAGFSTAATTWLPVAANYTTVNVATEEKDPDSLLNWHKKLIELRRTSPAMRDGQQVMTNTDSASVVSYTRKGTAGGASIVVAVNCSSQPQTISLAEGVSGTRVTTLVTDAPSLKTTTSLTSVTLPPYASWVGSVQ